jgi:RimJ/RimL family protein N-acetyltransferase
VLTPITETHLPAIWAWAEREDLAEFFRRFPPLHLWRAPAQAMHVLGACSLIADGERLLGLACLASVDMQSKNAELGVLVDKQAGASAKDAVAACSELADYAFDYLGLERLYARTMQGRRNIGRLLSLYGFKREGTLRNSLFWNGSFYNEELFSLLSSERKQ